MKFRSPLDYENYQVVSFVQASLGSISANVRVIHLQCKGEEVNLHFVLERESAEDREEIEGVVAELSALQDTNTPIVTHVQISTAPLHSIPHIGRPVFMRREGNEST
jgi:hypothetical protein